MGNPIMDGSEGTTRHLRYVSREPYNISQFKFGTRTETMFHAEVREKAPFEDDVQIQLSALSR